MPKATWAFWALMAAWMSPGVICTRLSLCGSSQTRMEYWLPNRVMSPTPSSRLRGSLMLLTT
ncbi:hypothetical protein D3C85_1724990 [compost metagenome]